METPFQVPSEVASFLYVKISFVASLTLTYDSDQNSSAYESPFARGTLWDNLKPICLYLGENFASRGPRIIVHVHSWAR